ncbi:hypothetical protein SDC9_202929 [bioreactor metagenome]|uniref:Uncharacterized protein n=1 Tax=bioreactor metagenome TaxID=1076179 RepID=A0A645IXU1_9ZZZZ
MRLEDGSEKTLPLGFIPHVDDALFDLVPVHLHEMGGGIHVFTDPAGYAPVQLIGQECRGPGR